MKDIYDSPAVQKMESVLRAAERANRIELSSEEAESIRDMCNHSRSSYAEETAVAELQELRDDLARIERKQDENQKAQAKDTQKAYNVSLIALGLNALAIIVAVLIARLH